MGGGILNDAGCYPINASRMLFESEPKGVFCNLIIDKETQVDTKSSVLMDFDGDKQSQSSVGYDLEYQSNYELWASDGFLSLTRAYNIPSDMQAKLKIKNSDKNEEILIEPVNHFQLMIEAFGNEIIESNHNKFNSSDSYDFVSMAKAQLDGKIDSWAIYWYFSVFQKNGLTLYPATSLVQNIGFDGSGTHYVRKTEKKDSKSFDLNFSIRKFPKTIADSKEVTAKIIRYLKKKNRKTYYLNFFKALLKIVTPWLLAN